MTRCVVIVRAVSVIAPLTSSSVSRVSKVLNRVGANACVVIKARVQVRIRLTFSVIVISKLLFISPRALSVALLASTNFFDDISGERIRFGSDMCRRYGAAGRCRRRRFWPRVLGMRRIRIRRLRCSRVRRYGTRELAAGRCGWLCRTWRLCRLWDSRWVNRRKS